MTPSRLLKFLNNTIVIRHQTRFGCGPQLAGVRWLATLIFLWPLAAYAQSAPTLVKLATGSEVATWTIPASGDKQHSTPILFLHGGPGLYTEERRFDEGQPFRAAGFTTVYFDQAGGGKSARLKAGEYTLDRAVEDIEALRVVLGQEQLILWGNSYGASLAALYANRFPEHVAAMILTSPGMFPGFSGKRDYSQTNRGEVEYSKEVRSAVQLIDAKGAAAEAGLSQDLAGKYFDELVSTELIDGIVCKGSSVKPPPLPGGGNLYAQREIFRDLKKLKFRPATLTKFPVLPVLIVRGSCDFVPMDSAEHYKMALGGEIIAIPDSGHGLLEHRDAVDIVFSRFAEGPLDKVR